MSRIIRWRVYKPIEQSRDRKIQRSAPWIVEQIYHIIRRQKGSPSLSEKDSWLHLKGRLHKRGRNSLLYSNEPFSERPLRDVKEKQRKDCCAFHREIDLVENGTNKDDGTILKTGWSKILRTWVRWCFINRFDKSFFCHFTIFSFLDLQLLRWLAEMQKTRIFI